MKVIVNTRENHCICFCSFYRRHNLNDADLRQFSILNAAYTHIVVCFDSVDTGPKHYEGKLVNVILQY